MKLSTKAQIEISFHWIFILIAGGAILAFFLMITHREKQGAEDQLTSAIGGRLEALLSAVGQNPDAVQLQDSLNVELQFRCEEDGHTYTVGNGERRFNLYSQIIFSPSSVGSSKIISWTKLYSTPYPTTQILYLSDEKTRYIFLDSNRIKTFYTLMPDLFSKNLTIKEDLETLEDLGFRNYIIITDSTQDLTLRNSIKRNAKIVRINFDTKKVIFIDPNTISEDQEIERPYANDEILFGAIISGDANLYGCTMEKIMHISRITGEMNKNRISQFEFDTASKCLYFYGSDVPQEYVQNIIGNSTYNNDAQQSYEQLNAAILSLSNLNKALATANCPTIY
ncbi:MAG: hypothetical protein ACP5N2_06815 [Candidatus Nanoarchaeia archaeon]